MLANRLLANLSILLLKVVKSLEYYVSCFPVSLDMLSLDVPLFTMLSLITCLISPAYVMISLTTYHLPPVMLTFDM